MAFPTRRWSPMFKCPPKSPLEIWRRFFELIKNVSEILFTGSLTGSGPKIHIQPLAALQPVDTSIFGTIKNSYTAWLMRESLERGIENIQLEESVRSMADIFWNLDVRSVNHGYKNWNWSLCLFRFWWRLIKKLCTLDYKYSI